MKGLLLKEFYLWLKTRSYFLILAAAISAFATIKGSYSYIFMGAMIGAIQNSYLLDEKSKWNEYSKTLPFTPYQRVAAKYIFHSCEYMLCVVIQSIALIFSSHTNNLFDFSPVEKYTLAVLHFFLAMTALSFMLPACILVKGNKKFVLSFIPALAYFYIYLDLVYDINSNMPGWVSELFSEKIWIYPVIIFVSVGILALSCMITVAVEAGKDNVYRKKFALRAIAVFTATAIICVASFGVLFFGGTLPDPSFGNEVSSAKVKKAQEELYPYYDFLCNESNIGKTYDECADTLRSLGFSESEKKTGSFLSESGIINVYIEFDKEKGLVERITASPLTVNQKILEKADDSDFENIKNNFTVGMEEKELHNKIKEMELIPSSVTERDVLSQPKRYYYFSFATDKYNTTGHNSVVYSISVEVTEGKISNVNSSVYESVVVKDLPLENQSANPVATRDEMRILIDGFCKTNHLEQPVEDTILDFEAIGFTGGGKSGSVRSASGNITANVATESETGLTDYIYISGNVGEYRIEKATTQDLDKLCETFTEGMSEDELHAKFYELDVLPHEILESRNYEKNHLRNYEITYTVGSYNGGEGTDFEINIDVINGKVYDVRAYD